MLSGTRRQTVPSAVRQATAVGLAQGAIYLAFAGFAIASASCTYCKNGGLEITGVLLFVLTVPLFVLVVLTALLRPVARTLLLILEVIVEAIGVLLAIGLAVVLIHGVDSDLFAVALSVGFVSSLIVLPMIVVVALRRASPAFVSAAASRRN